jgi:hypothetical protein
MFDTFKSVLLFCLVVSFLPVTSVAQTAQCGVAVPGQPLPDLIVDSLRLKLDTIVTTEKFAAKDCAVRRRLRIRKRYSPITPLHVRYTECGARRPCDR